VFLFFAIALPFNSELMFPIVWIFDGEGEAITDNQRGKIGQLSEQNGTVGCQKLTVAPVILPIGTQPASFRSSFETFCLKRCERLNPVIHLDLRTQVLIEGWIYVNSRRVIVS
jgi:hypothetical protein